jgi:hypothetical protein
VGTTKVALRRLAELFALNPDHVEEANLMLTRKGCPTDMGFLCYKVAPPFLLEHSKVRVGGFELSVVPLNRDASCKECGGKCHTAAQCPYKALEGWRASSIGGSRPSMNDGKEKEKEKAVEETDDASSDDSEDEGGKRPKKAADVKKAAEREGDDRKGKGKGGSSSSSSRGGGKKSN